MSDTPCSSRYRGSAVRAENGGMEEFCTLDFAIRALACVVVGEVLSCTYSAGQWSVAFGCVVPEMKELVALGYFIKLEIGGDTETVSEAE